MKEGNSLIGGYSTPIFIYRTKHLTYSNIKVSGEQLHCGPKICFCSSQFSFGQSTLFFFFFFLQVRESDYTQGKIAFYGR